MAGLSTCNFVVCYKATLRPFKHCAKNGFRSSKRPDLISFSFCFLCPLYSNFTFHCFSYPFEWYIDIVTNPKFLALAATLNDRLVGLLVAQLKPQCKCNREDQGLLSRRFDKRTKVAYILTLGVVKEFRRLGIATYLLTRLIDLLTTGSVTQDCKAVFLHVLSTNHVAIRFYEKLNFKRYRFLPFYYHINGGERDGYLYVRYLNGGSAPICMLDHLQPLWRFMRSELCTLWEFVRFCLKRLQRFGNRLLPPFATTSKDKQHTTQLIFC